MHQKCQQSQERLIPKKQQLTKTTQTRECVTMSHFRFHRSHNAMMRHSDTHIFNLLETKKPRSTNRSF